MVQEEKTVVTKEGYQELVNELDNMLHVVRQDVIRELQEARAQGDLSENADYDAARERQARVEARIRDLEAMIANAQIIDDNEKVKAKKTVKLGSTVRILDMDTNSEETYTIVGSVEADPLNGRLSNLTPLAMAGPFHLSMAGHILGAGQQQCRWITTTVSTLILCK